MKTILTWVIVAAVTIGLVCVVLPWFRDIVWQAREDANKFLSDQIRIQNIITAARADIQRDRDGLQEPLTKTLIAKEKLQSLANEKAALTEELAKHEAGILRGNELLSKSGESIIVNGKTTTREEVQADIDKRAVRCKDIRIKLPGTDQAYQELDAGIKQSFAEIRNAKVELDRTEQELDHMQVMLETEQAIDEVRKTIDSFLGKLPDSGRNRHLAKIRELTAGFAAKDVIRSMGSGSSDFLDYDGLTTSSTVSSADAYIAEYLSTSSKPAKVSVEGSDFLDLGKPAPKPAAGQ